MSDSELISLDEAAALIPGCDRATLLRRARQGRLTVYRPGKAYLTTRADVDRMVQASVVKSRGRPQPERPATDTSALAHASAALDAALAQLRQRRR
jgi:excisionase family DNA binding protein